MDKLSRRSLLRTLALGVVSTAGTTVVARSALAAAPSSPEGIDPSVVDVQDRAAGLENIDLGPAGEAHAQFLNFPGVGFGNGGGFRNGGFRNGGFRNSPFRNFRNSPFRNGGFRNGGFRNGGGGFRNAFRNR